MTFRQFPSRTLRTLYMPYVRVLKSLLLAPHSFIVKIIYNSYTSIPLAYNTNRAVKNSCLQDRLGFNPSLKGQTRLTLRLDISLKIKFLREI